MSFFRHARSIGPMAEQSHWGAEAPLLIVRDESHRLSLGGLLSSRARFRFAGCAQHAMKKFRQSSSFQQTATCGLTGCLSPGVHPTAIEGSFSNTNMDCPSKSRSDSGVHLCVCIAASKRAYLKVGP